MHERIKELAKQATVHGNTEHHLDIPSWYLEKFAELIVQECAKACEKNSYMALNGWQRAKQIREHFGVEK